jgi:protein-tyrosine phosphatase
MMEAGRDLGLHGAPNARDLGGYRCVDGRVVRPGMLLRSEALTYATEADLDVLHGLGLAMVIDLRGEAEAAGRGTGPWPGPRTHLPTTDVTQTVFAELVSAGPNAEPRDEDILVKIMVEMYRQFVADESGRSAFSAALNLIAETTRGGQPVLFHCTAGKDRTGWLAALVLTGIGVDRADVYADYLLTNERSSTGRGAEARARLLATLHRMVGESQPLLPLIEVRPVYLDAAFAEVEARYGSVEEFLVSGLGFDVERFRETVLMP